MISSGTNASGQINSLVKSTCIFARILITMIPIPSPTPTLIQSPIRKSAKITRSIRAVGLDAAASAKKIPDIRIYVLIVV
jgi:hypothetical protein